MTVLFCVMKHHQHELHVCWLWITGFQMSPVRHITRSPLLLCRQASWFELFPARPPVQSRGNPFRIKECRCNINPNSRLLFGIIQWNHKYRFCCFPSLYVKEEGCLSHAAVLVETQLCHMRHGWRRMLQYYNYVHFFMFFIPICRCKIPWCQNYAQTEKALN